MSRPSQTGWLTSIGGAGVLFASLWLPWYEVRIPDALREAFRGMGGSGQGSSRSGPENFFGEFFAGLASVIPQSLEVNGWTVMQQGDIALAVLASLVLLAGLVGGGLLGSSVRADAGTAARLITLMGAASLAIAGFHLLTRPTGGFPGGSDFADLRHGVWVAMAGSAAILVGGLVAAGSGKATVTSPGPGVPLGAIAPELAGESGQSPETPVYTAAPASSLAPPGWS